MKTTAEVEDEIAKLGELPRPVLVERWTTCHGTAPPRGIGRQLLELSAAYALQASVYGGLGRKRQKQLMSLSRFGDGGAGSDVSPALKPGSRLVRAWNGRSHHVEVTEHGFEWNGQAFKSLSAVAREITGTRWSGPRFFGVGR
jgi:hypothetical protein